MEVHGACGRADVLRPRARLRVERAAKAFERYAAWRKAHPRAAIDRFAEAFDTQAQHRAEALRWQIELDVAKAQSELLDAEQRASLGAVEFFIDKAFEALAAWCDEVGLARVARALRRVLLIRAWEMGDSVLKELRAGLW